MATVFEQQPDKLNRVRSPMVYTLSDTNSGNEGFQFVLDVYVWSGDPTSVPASFSQRLKKPVLVSNVASFDISKIVKSFITPKTDPETINDVDYADGSIVNVVCKAGWIDATGSSLANATSDTVWAVNGYYDYLDGINYYDAFSPLTLRSNIQIQENGREALGIFYDTDVNVTSVRYGGGGTSYVLDLTSYVDITGIVDSDEKLIYVPIGYANLAEYNTNNGPFAALTAILESGIDTIQFIGTGGASLTVETICEPKYTPLTVWFVNKYGAWDFLNVFKKTEVKATAEGQKYISRATNASGTYTYNSNLGQYKRYNVDGERTITVNTGFIDETAATMVEQILLSEQIAIYNGTTMIPVIPATRDMVFKTGLNDKLINYTLEFTYASNSINTM